MGRVRFCRPTALASAGPVGPQNPDLWDRSEFVVLYVEVGVTTVQVAG
jgi:hypothetical protein